MEHINSALELLRREPSFQMAQMASDAMSEAQGMLESRRRFALNFGS